MFRRGAEVRDFLSKSHNEDSARGEFTPKADGLVPASCDGLTRVPPSIRKG
jgi:hypothetical protein